MRDMIKRLFYKLNMNISYVAYFSVSNNCDWIGLKLLFKQTYSKDAKLQSKGVF